MPPPARGRSARAVGELGVVEGRSTAPGASRGVGHEPRPASRSCRGRSRANSVGLHGEGAVPVDQGGVGAEGGGGTTSPLGLRHLVLVPGVERERLAVPVVFGAADGPAAGELLDLAAQRLGDDLVAEADADEGTPRRRCRGSVSRAGGSRDGPRRRPWREPVMSQPSASWGPWGTRRPRRPRCGKSKPRSGGAAEEVGVVAMDGPERVGRMTVCRMPMSMGLHVEVSKAYARTRRQAPGRPRGKRTVRYRQGRARRRPWGARDRVVDGGSAPRACRAPPGYLESEEGEGRAGRCDGAFPVPGLATGGLTRACKPGQGGACTTRGGWVFARVWRGGQAQRCARLPEAGVPLPGGTGLARSLQ
jgi:hypothetical protein